MGRNARGWHGGRASGRAGLGAGWNPGNSAQSNCRCSENRPGELRWMGTSLQASGRSPLWIPDTESKLHIPKFFQPCPGCRAPHCLGQEPCCGWELGQMDSELGGPQWTEDGPQGPKQIIATLVSRLQADPPALCQDPGLTVSLPCSKPIHSSPGAMAWNRRPPGSGLLPPHHLGLRWSLFPGCLPSPFFCQAKSTCLCPSTSPLSSDALAPRYPRKHTVGTCFSSTSLSRGLSLWFFPQPSQQTTSP